MKKIIIEKYPHMLHGGDYNPDQWQDCPDILAKDMELMQKANCNEIHSEFLRGQHLNQEKGSLTFLFFS